MGRYDSSKTRVVPVFNELFNLDPTGKKWLTRLLKLPKHGGSRPAFGKSAYSGLKPLSLGTIEKALQPPRALLEWLVRNPDLKRGASIGNSTTTIAKRTGLIGKDQRVINEALTYLRKPLIPESAWYVLEGPSFPDVFIETDKLIIVIEGKRTEELPTRHTSWKRVRDQMLRHIDCAWDYPLRNGRSVYGMLIVEGKKDSTAVPKFWINEAKKILGSPIFDESLIHRTKSERSKIAKAFLGVTTWQAVCKKFGIPFNSLPEFCED